jgi:hypothetical protein
VANSSYPAALVRIVQQYLHGVLTLRNRRRRLLEFGNLVARQILSPDDAGNRVQVLDLAIEVCPRLRRTPWLGMKDSNSQMSAQIIPLKSPTDFRESSRILTTETIRV